jgi:hypothetical protein
MRKYDNDGEMFLLKKIQVNDKELRIRDQSSGDISLGTKTVVPVIFIAAETLPAVLFFKTGHSNIAVSLWTWRTGLPSG